MPSTTMKLTALALAAAAMLAACGGGGDDAPPPVVSVPTSGVPLAAQSSVPGLIAYLNTVIPMTDETAEPILIGDAVLPTDDTAEPS